MGSHEEPLLEFFRRKPGGLSSHHALASSLQRFESCLFLIALQRFPDALTACTFAIEGALKGRDGYSGEREGLQKLLVGACREFPRLASFSLSELDEFRVLRNRFVHEGFSLSDRSVAASALLTTGLPFLMSTYDVVYGFDLCDALVTPFGEQLTTAIAVYNQPKQEALDSVLALSVVGHLTRWSIRGSMMAPWERAAVDPSENYDLELDLIAEFSRWAERKLEPAWHFDCPICSGFETLVCQLDDESLAQEQIRLLAGFCAGCGLQLSSPASSLLNALCSDVITEYRDEILAGFGITSTGAGSFGEVASLND